MISRTITGALSLLAVLSLNLPCQSQEQQAKLDESVTLKGEVDRSGYGLDGRPRPGNNSKPGSNSRPDWVPSDAYTNPQMVMESYIRVGRGRRPIRVSEGVFNLESSIARYWTSSRNYPSCQVYMRPMWKHPGDFTFSSLNNPDGPKGWIQEIGNSPEGFPMYRFWYSHASMTPMR